MSVAGTLFSFADATLNRNDKTASGGDSPIADAAKRVLDPALRDESMPLSDLGALVAAAVAERVIVCAGKAEPVQLTLAPGDDSTLGDRLHALVSSIAAAGTPGKHADFDLSATVLPQAPHPGAELVVLGGGLIDAGEVAAVAKRAGWRCLFVRLRAEGAERAEERPIPGDPSSTYTLFHASGRDACTSVVDLLKGR